MRPIIALLVLLTLVFCTAATAEVPNFENTVFMVNLKADKLLDSFYSSFEQIDKMKPFLLDFDQVFQKNAGLNPRKDLKDIGLLVSTDKKAFNIIAYVNGRFNPAKIMSEFESALKLIPENSAKKMELQGIKGKKVLVCTDKRKKRSISTYFHSPTLMLVSESKTIEKIIAGKIKLDTSTKKSLDIDLASELSLWINTTGLKNNLTKIKHPAAGAISGVVGMFDSIKASINNNDLTLGFKCANQETAENLKTFLEGQVAGYKMFISSQLNNQKLPDKEPKWLPKAFKALFARAMALSARQTLNATKITQKNLEIYLTSTLPPLSGLLLNPATIATTGALAAIAIPNFQKARKIAKQKKCFANQRKIAAAIKKYNNDNENKLRTLDDKVLNTLIEKGYLKKYPTCSDNGKYRSLGDISAEGVINCTRHGSVEMK